MPFHWTLPLAIVLATLGSVILRSVLTARWLRARAEVIALGRPDPAMHDSEVHATMVPLIRFTTAAGAVTVVEDKKFRVGPALPGDRLEILYSPGDPRQVVTASFPRRFRMELVILTAGLALLGASVVS
jgi:hypothetical protein